MFPGSSALGPPGRELPASGIQHHSQSEQRDHLLRRGYDPEGVLDSLVSAMSTIAHNNAVSSGACAVILGPEHASTIASKTWSRQDVRRYLWSNTTNTYDDISFGGRYGQIYNRNLPRWYKREKGARIPIVPSPDDIHLFVAGGEDGRFAAFLPGWGHMSAPVLRALDGRSLARDTCIDGTCEL